MSTPGLSRVASGSRRLFPPVVIIPMNTALAPAAAVVAATPGHRLFTLGLATDAEAEEFARLRHDVDARELGQHLANGAARLAGRLVGSNITFSCATRPRWVGTSERAPSGWR